MEHGEVVLGLLLPADEEAPESVEPGVGSFDDPATGTIAGFGLERGHFFAAGSQVQREAELVGELPDLREVIALVQTEPLWPFDGRPRAPDGDRFKRLARELEVVAVSFARDDAQGNAGSISEERALRPFLALSVGLGPVSSPPRGALVIAPSSASQSQSTPCSAS